MPGADISYRFRGLREVERALDRLPAEAHREIKDQREQLSRRLAELVRAAGRADSRVAAAAARTVRTGVGGEMVIAGPEKRLFGSEFGSNSRWGWYSASRYRSSPARAFKPHRGSASYWFFRTIREQKPAIDEAWSQALDAIVRAWGA